jgi:hypothetical protein
MPSSPPRSRRAKILNNLQRQLETITVANGYSRDVYKVTTSVKAWRDTPEAETPVIYIIDDSTRYEYHPGRLTERTWTISLFGVMKSQTQSDMEELISDIEDCLQANVPLAFPDTGRVVAHHRITQIVTDNQLFSEIEGSQLFKMTIDFIYTACVDQIR